MEEEVLSVETQEVAEPVVDEVVETSEQTQEVAEPVTQEVVDEPKTETRDYEKDAAFAKMRRTMEQSQKEMEALKAEKERLANALGWFGFKGNTDEIEDQAKAHYTGRSIEEIRQERIAEAQKISEEKKMQEELEYYRQKSVQERMAADLKEIQKLDPNIKSWEDMPQKYFENIKKGLDGPDAFMAMRNREYYEKFKKLEEQQNAAKIQANAKASVGSASGGQTNEPVSYANMSDAEFEKLLAKVKRGEMTSTI